MPDNSAQRREALARRRAARAARKAHSQGRSALDKGVKDKPQQAREDYLKKARAMSPDQRKQLTDSERKSLAREAAYAQNGKGDSRNLVFTSEFYHDKEGDR